MRGKALLTAVGWFAVSVTAAVAQTPAPAQAKRYHLEGKVVSLRPAAGQAVIDAKAIPGYMAAMAMPYTIKDSTELKRLKPGDQITADVVVSGGKSWLENIKPMSATKDTTQAPKPS